ncbi:hypothetical protein UVI_02042730 [Ustilaginoidea virens]|nr:hypothetical protein UVI_02042730 [Ustilaginoidea virens]
MVAIAQALGEGGVSMLLDDAGQVPILSELHRLSGIVPLAYIKIDMGGRRAGVEAQSQRFLELADAALEAHDRGRMILSGLYSHAGHSYGGDSPTAAVKMMAAELTALLQGADRLTARAADRSSAAGLHRLVLSAGASPTSLAVQNLIAAAEQQGHRKSPEGQIKPEVASLAGVLATARDRGHVVELHAGVYPILDLQQLAAHSVDPRRLSWGDMALTIVAEVHSRYPGRGAGGTDEALVGAGGLALAREPCKAYEGVAMLTPWGRCGASLPSCEVEDYRGWIVGRVSQEHGILTWRSGGAAEGESQAAEPDALPEVGDKVRLWPNHACIASSHYGWYFVVDESRCGKEDEIVDVYIRARGW